jgi:hypothetical protein
VAVTSALSYPQRLALVTLVHVLRSDFFREQPFAPLETAPPQRCPHFASQQNLRLSGPEV